MRKEVISFALSLLLLFGLTAPEALAAELYASKPLFSASEVIAAPGETVTMDISITNNPGILAAKLALTYDSKLTLVSAQAGPAFSSLAMTKPGSLTSPCNFFWDGVTPANQDGVVLTLTFMVSSTVAAGEMLPVQLSTDSRDVLDYTQNFLEVDLLGGLVSILDYLPGDLNGDKSVDVTDIILMRRHIVGGYNVTVNTSAADVDGDGFLTGRDVVTMRQYVAGGYGVELKPSPVKCIHMMAATPLTPATCTESGNIAYWHCTICGKYFSNAEGTAEISADRLAIQPLGHSPVIDAAKAPTETETGLTEGAHCETCGMVIKAQEIVPILEANYYSITYSNRVTNGNLDYLNQLVANGKLENPNPTRYAQSSENLVLEEPHVAGYVFQGWYDGVGDSASQVISIPAGSTGNKILYARWTEETYTIQFDSPLVPMADASYTVSTGKTLTNPEWDGYTFIGWSDDDANIVTSILPGTTGNITLHANWTSLRNQTRPVSKLKDPVIYEDYDNNLILFAYEIGTVENIPLYIIKDFGNTNGITVTETISKTASVSSSAAESIANAVSNATTNSSSWTLSEEWNETTQYSQNYSSETGYTYDEALSVGKSSTGTWNIGSGVGGTKATTTVDGSSWGVSGKVSGSIGKKDVASVGLEVGGNYGEDHSTTSSQSKNWNINAGYQKSSSTSANFDVSSSLSQRISEQTGYGKSYLQGGSSSSSQGLSTSQTASREYASSFTYSTAETTTTSRTYSNENAKSGWYRIVCAGTAHVFAVVGYDIATRTYFAYSYSVMDDETHEFLDYSKSTSLYNDYENGVLPFEVPYFVNEYVDSIVYASDGLVVDVSSGTIMRYNGNDTDVIIPRYMPVSNGDGTVTVVKITGIDSRAFQGNTNIQSISLNDGISEIPPSAFKGCSALRTISWGEITSIGNSAFAGCNKISNFIVPSTVTFLGSDAFAGIAKITVNVANASVVETSVNSGAKQIILNLATLSGGLDNNVLTIPAGTEYFEFNGSGQSFQNLTIISDADKTVINNATLSGVKDIPLQLSSPSVTLNRVNVSAPGFALRLSAEQTTLGLFGNVDISSSSSNTILCKNLTLTWSNPSAVGKLNAYGNVLICGTLADEDESLNVSNGEIKYITADMYEQMLHSCTVTFDSNGGVCTEVSRDVLTGTAIGSLPVPVREYYTFDGWYLEDGTQVTESTVFSSGTDVTLLARWTIKPASGWVLAAAAPAGAQILNEKWTYNQRTNTESRSTSLSGYTQYGSYWVQSGSGSTNYATFPSGYDTSNYIYTNFAKSGYSSYENTTSKRVVSNAWAGYVYWHWMYNVAYANTTVRAISSARGTYSNLAYIYFYAFTSSTNCAYLDNYYCNNQNLPSYNCNSVLPDKSSIGVGTPRFFRFDYYKSTYTDYYKMFQYYKIEAKESSAAVTATSLITNVQHWVQYREA